MVIFFITKISANDIFVFLEKYSNSRDSINNENILNKEKLNELEKDIYLFLLAKNFFLQKNFLKAQENIHNLPDSFSDLITENFSQELLKNFSNYSTADIISSLDLFPDFFNNKDLLLQIKDHLPDVL